MTGDELQEWVATLARATAAQNLKRDDLAKAMFELTATEREKVISNMKGIVAYIQGAAHFLGMLKGE